MENKKISNRARNTISILIAAVCGVIMYIDYKICEIGSTPLQWGVFLVALFIVIYLQLLYDINEEVVDYEPHEYPLKDDAFPIENNSPLDLDVISKDYVSATDWEKKIEEIENEFNSEPEKSTGKPVFIVQPMMVVTQEEFDSKTNNMINDKEKPKELKQAPPRLEPVRTYTLNGVAQKRRGMFNDICSFATTGEFKTLAEINKKIAPHGLQYDILQPENRKDLIAFDFKEFRMPLIGYFGIKVTK